MENIKKGRMALVAGLALVAGIAGTTGVALAATTNVGDTGSITVTDAVNGTYYAYKLFDGTFEDFEEDGETVTKMGDAVLNETYKDVILEALEQAGHEVDTTDLSERALANAVLDEFLAIEEEGTMRTFANLLAYLLEESGLVSTVTSTSTDGLLEFENLACGYWLVKQDSTTPTDEDGEEVTDYAMTTALLIAVDGDEEAEAKVTVPTIDKEVIDNTLVYAEEAEGDEDTDGDGVADLRHDLVYGKTADSGATTTDDTVEMCSISYLVTGTVSGNIADYDTYYYAFHDQLPEVISFSSTEITIPSQHSRLTNSTDEDGNSTGDVWRIELLVDSQMYDISEYFTALYTADSDGLTTIHWFCEDLLEAFKDNDIDSSLWASAEVLLYYEFELTEDEITAYLSEVSSLSYLYAETNYVYIEYSNNPYPNNPITQDAGTTSETPEDLNRVYSYNLEISKVDEDGNALDGAEFELTYEYEDEEGNTVTVSAGYLIVSDGENLVEGSSLTYEDGTFIFTGLEADVEYTLTEVSVPSGYKSIDPITFIIRANLDETGYEIVSISVDPETTTDPSGATVLTTSDATVYMTVANVEGYDLPLTGQAGIAAGIAIGGLVLVVSLAAVSKKKKADEFAA